MSKTAFEVNFDGLVGPTHNFGGLSYGNVASSSHGKQVSNPREAARQGLLKMKALHERGFKQAILPPHERPDVALLRQLGFQGSDAQVIDKAGREAPGLLVAACSASPMWTANAATVSPSADTVDGKVHFTPANLNAKLHRAREHLTTARILKAIFADESRFAHHQPLPGVADFGDEGAANHTRFCRGYGDPGVELFVYGRIAGDPSAAAPQRYPARHTRQACEAVARLHGLPEARVVHAQQRPEAIDAGVFHNDVIAVGNRDVLFYHEEAFLDTQAVLGELERKLDAAGARLNAICVPSDQVSLSDAVSTYLFNSQLLSADTGQMVLLVPGECQENQRVADYLNELIQSGPIAEVLSRDLRQSMKNGGGPACLRLRVVLTEEEIVALGGRVMLDGPLLDNLLQWVERHYRDRLSPDDLRDPALLDETRRALDELTGILKLPGLYDFQR